MVSGFGVLCGVLKHFQKKLVMLTGKTGGGEYIAGFYNILNLKKVYFQTVDYYIRVFQ